MLVYNKYLLDYLQLFNLLFVCTISSSLVLLYYYYWHHVFENIWSVICICLMPKSNPKQFKLNLFKTIYDLHL